MGETITLVMDSKEKSPGYFWHMSEKVAPLAPLCEFVPQGEFIEASRPAGVRCKNCLAKAIEKGILPSKFDSILQEPWVWSWYFDAYGFPYAAVRDTSRKNSDGEHEEVAQLAGDRRDPSGCGQRAAMAVLGKEALKYVLQRFALMPGCGCALGMSGGHEAECQLGRILSDAKRLGWSGWTRFDHELGPPLPEKQATDDCTHADFVAGRTEYPCECRVCVRKVLDRRARDARG